MIRLATILVCLSAYCPLAAMDGTDPHTSSEERNTVTKYLHDKRDLHNNKNESESADHHHISALIPDDVFKKIVRKAIAIPIDRENVKTLGRLRMVCKNLNEYINTNEEFKIHIVYIYNENQIWANDRRRRVATFPQPKKRCQCHKACCGNWLCRVSAVSTGGACTRNNNRRYWPDL